MSRATVRKIAQRLVEFDHPGADILCIGAASWPGYVARAQLLIDDLSPHVIFRKRWPAIEGKR